MKLVNIDHLLTGQLAIPHMGVVPLPYMGVVPLPYMGMVLYTSENEKNIVVIILGHVQVVVSLSKFHCIITIIRIISTYFICYIYKKGCGSYSHNQPIIFLKRITTTANFNIHSKSIQWYLMSFDSLI